MPREQRDPGLLQLPLNSIEPMKSYSTLIFDAFDTVIHIERSRLPRHVIGDSFGHSTAPRVYEAYAAEAGTPRFAEFVAAFLESSAEAYRRRRANLREISSPDRFRIMLELLETDPEDCPADFPERLAKVHMETFQAALEIRPDSLQLLDWAADQGYRMAMISNFDYSPTLYECLERYAVHDVFEVIVVSDEIGWRKPHPKIFAHTLEQLNVTPEEALFVGDRLAIDVDGAVQTGMDAAWIDTGHERWTFQHSRPHFTIGSLGELKGALAGSDEP